MKIPKEVMVAGHPWHIEYKWRLHDPKIGDCNGLCDFKSKTILIDRLLPKDDKWEVFLHELTHAILHEAHLHEDGGVDGFAEEVICSSIANVFNQLFDFRWKKGVKSE